MRGAAEVVDALAADGRAARSLRRRCARGFSRGPRPRRAAPRAAALRCAPGAGARRGRRGRWRRACWSRSVSASRFATCAARSLRRSRASRASRPRSPEPRSSATGSPQQLADAAAERDRLAGGSPRASAPSAASPRGRRAPSPSPARRRRPPPRRARSSIPRRRRLVLVVYELPPPPPGRSYQLWVIVGGEPVSAGVFEVEAAGAARYETAEVPPHRGPGDDRRHRRARGRPPEAERSRSCWPGAERGGTVGARRRVAAGDDAHRQLPRPARRLRLARC